MECQTLRRGGDWQASGTTCLFQTILLPLRKKGSSMVWNALNYVPVGTLLGSIVLAAVKVMSNLCLIKMSHGGWCIVKAG